MKKDLKLSIIRLIGILLSFGIQVLFIKIIGTAEYGIYILFTTWSAILSQVMILGYDRLLIKELSCIYLQREKEKFRFILDKVLLFVGLNSIAFMLLAICIPLTFLQNTLFSNELLRSTWVLIAVGSAMFTGFQIIGKILITTQRVAMSFIRSELVYKLVLLISVLLFSFYFRKLFGLNIILAGVVLSYALTIFLFLFWDRKKLWAYTKLKKQKVVLGYENYIFFILTLNYFLISQIDKIQLGRMASMQTLGLYGLATTLCAMTGFSIVGYARFIPKISNYIHKKMLGELESEFKIVVRNAVIIALPVMMFLMVFTEDVLLFFGYEYVKVSTALRILLAGQMIYYFTGPNGNLLNNGGYAKVDLLNSIVVLVLTTILSYLGFKLYGLNGIALATSLGIAIVNLVKVVEVKWFFKIFPYDWENLCLTIIALASFCLVRVACFSSQNLILKLVINFAAGTAVSMIIAFLFYKMKGQTLIKNSHEKCLGKLRAFSVKAN